MGARPSRLDRYTFREFGFVVEPFSAHFEEAAPDVEWINKAAAEEWVVLTKDSEIWRHPIERMAIQNSGLRVFSLTRSRSAPGHSWLASTGPERSPRSPT